MTYNRIGDRMHIELGEDGQSIVCDFGKGERLFVSHAHSDHTSYLSHHNTVLTSHETAALLNLSRYTTTLPHVKLLNAGHMLGSKQLLFDEVLYTGDLKVEGSVLCDEAEVVDAKLVLLDATFGDFDVRFPAFEDVFTAVERWVRGAGVKLLGVYRLGKAQEVIHMLNEMGVVPLVDDEVAKFCEVYKRFGVVLDYVRVNSEEGEELKRKDFVALVPMKLAHYNFAFKLSQALRRRVEVSVVSGWAGVRRFKAHKAFALSDHSDVYRLVEFVEAVNARSVVPLFCKSCKVLRQMLVERGIEVVSAKKHLRLLPRSPYFLTSPFLKTT